jgi:hypothetical protein
MSAVALAIAILDDFMPIIDLAQKYKTVENTTERARRKTRKGVTI